MTTNTYIPVDIETTGLSFMKDRILGIGYGDTFFPFPSHPVPGALTAHNFKFEYKFFKKNNIPANIEFDTLLATSILIDRPPDLDLGTVASYYLGWDSWKSDTDKLFKKKNWVQLYEADPKLQEALKERNLYDLKSTAELSNILRHCLNKENMTNFYFDKLMPAAKLLADCEYRGMRIDVTQTQETLTRIESQIGQLLTRLNSWAKIEINWNSPMQLKEFLKERGYSLWTYDFKKRLTVESTGSDVLEKLLPNDNIQMLLDYRGAIKLHAFLKGWLDDQIDGRIYPSYNVASTRTGRLSCSSPNLQQVPRDKSIRSLFIPSPGKVFVIADYAQIEPRVAAHYTKDEALTEVFMKGLDFYGSIAVNVLGTNCTPNEVKEKFPKDRKVAKEIGLSILYGIGPAKLSSIIKKRTGRIFSKEDCARIIKNYFESYPKLLEFRNYIERKALNNEILRTDYGRQFKINPDKVFSTGVNTLVQSTASDACLFSQLDVEKKLKEYGIDAPLVAIVHDEIIRECSPKDADTVGYIMQSIMENQGFECPLKLDWTVGNNWGDKT